MLKFYMKKKPCSQREELLGCIVIESNCCGCSITHPFNWQNHINSSLYERIDKQISTYCSMYLIPPSYHLSLLYNDCIAKPVGPPDTFPCLALPLPHVPRPLRRLPPGAVQLRFTDVHLSTNSPQDVNDVTSVEQRGPVESFVAVSVLKHYIRRFFYHSELIIMQNVDEVSFSTE